MIRQYSDELSTMHDNAYELSLYVFQELCAKYRTKVEECRAKGESELRRMFNVYMLRNEGAD